MKSKSLVLLAFAGICGLVAMLGVRKALSNKEPAVETVSVLVATADLSATARLDESNSEFKAVPVDQVPEGAITDRAQYLERQLLVRLLPGDWVTETKLSDKGSYGIESQIPPGMRVVSVPVNLTTSHSGMLAPGNRVDVMLTYQARTDSGSMQRTRTVLQYIEIFAVDKLIDGAKASVNDGSRNVSVLVTPEQASLLLLAGKKGDIHLALRSNSDVEQVANVDIDESRLDGISLEGAEQSRQDMLNDLYGLGEEGEPLAESVDQQLEAAAADSVAGQVTVVEPEQTQPVWEMTIYSGGEATTTEVIDESVVDEPVAPTSATAQKKGSFWKGLIGSYFRGA
ncbi:MAG: Flp pilus assembly protein CpaB [Planctomycetaceae bacterium]